MRVFIESMVKLLEAKENFALATIIRQQGSGPGTLGAHMIICHDGSILGTIGGGAVEALVQSQAREVIGQRKKRCLNLNLNPGDNDHLDMVCGGRVEILVDFIDVEQKVFLDVYKAIRESLHLGQRVWLVNSLSESELKPAGPWLVRSSGEIMGSLPVQVDSFFFKVKKVLRLTVWDDLQLFVEPFADSGTAYIFGAGHIALKLVPLLNMVGFRTVVIDERSEYANRERFATADQVLVMDFEEFFQEVKTDAHSYIVIVTRGHAHDKQVLAQALKGQVAYIGMIGSRKKRDAIYKALVEEGGSFENLKRVFSPIGLKIQAEGPEEIAVSITAEMIKVRAGKRLEGI